ncbi:MAG: hypothetical protein JO345_04145 [Streptosporangiaceae bacterium]|nr:hypothetical protein [Streptosporangiaceae bacterium]
MELSPGRQKLLFMAIVVMLAAVGYFLVVPALHKSPAAKPAAAPSTPAAPAVTGAPSTALNQPGPSAAAAPSGSQAPAGTVDIYNWLPFTQRDLASAAAVADQFSVDYDTFTYTESPASYVAKMNGLITQGLAAQLQNAYSTPGTATLRTSQRQVSTATAAIVSLRAFGGDSMTFIVNIGQRLVSSQGNSNSSTQYAVTLTGSGESWQVNDVELQQAGNT